MRSKSISLLVSLFFALSSDFLIACDSLELLSGWVKNPVSGTNYTAAYFSIKNNGTKLRIISSFSSPNFSKVIAHITEEDSGQVRMQHMKELVINAGNVINANPGGLHLMLKFAEKDKFKIGQHIPFSAQCDDNTVWEFSLPIKSS